MVGGGIHAASTTSLLRPFPRYPLEHCRVSRQSGSLAADSLSRKRNTSVRLPSIRFTAVLLPRGRSGLLRPHRLFLLGCRQPPRMEQVEAMDQRIDGGHFLAIGLGLGKFVSERTKHGHGVRAVELLVLIGRTELLPTCLKAAGTPKAPLRQLECFTAQRTGEPFPLKAQGDRHDAVASGDHRPTDPIRQLLVGQICGQILRYGGRGLTPGRNAWPGSRRPPPACRYRYPFVPG